MQITEQQFRAAFPKCRLPQEYCIALNNAFKRFDIGQGKVALAAFLSQCGQECDNFTVFEENLNYRADTLQRLWPKRFDAIKAQLYAHKPSQIASYVYAARMGNGPESSGDGWKFRGRGVLQLTGRENYTKFNQALQTNPLYAGAGNVADVLREPDLLAKSPRYSVLSGIWYWCECPVPERDANGKVRYDTKGRVITTRVAKVAQSGDIRAITIAVNGGTNGLEQRIKKFERLKAIL